MPAALSRPLKIGTDCSGLETPLMALERLAVPFRSAWSCDISPSVKSYLRTVYPEGQWFDDLMARDHGEAPDIDLYVAGFPCQSFSAAGKRSGFKDERGKVFFGVRDTIQAKLPRAFVLENVQGLYTHDEGRTFNTVMEKLVAIKMKGIGGSAYEVVHKKLNTKEHGVPQSRPRVYIIGIRKDCQRSEFKFPEPIPEPSVDGLLDANKGSAKDLPSGGPGTVSYDNVKDKLAELRSAGAKPLKVTHFIDCESSPYRCTAMKGRTMCMTKSRPMGFWITSRARRANLDEMLRLQGMDPAAMNLKVPGVTRRQYGQMVGNAMSQNVVERILARLLPAAGLVKGPVADPWEKAAKGTKRKSTDSESRPAKNVRVA